MAIQVVTQVGSSVALSNSVRTQYIENYLDGAIPERLYDQLASPVGKNMEELQRGSSVQVEFLSDMQPGTTAISEIADITPQTLVDATASITPTSRGEALQASEKLMLTVFTDYNAKIANRVGKNMMETVDSLARDAATQGSLIQRVAATRATLDAGTTSHHADEGTLLTASGTLQSLKVPGYVDPVNGSASWAAITHPMVFHDFLRAGNILSIAQYQKASILLNHELGLLHGFRLVVSPWAKVFYGSGAANAKSVATEIKSDVSALDKLLTASVTSSVENGLFLNIIDTQESANTHVSTNERVKYVNHTNSPVISFVGEGANGGLRFPHVGGTALLTNNDSAYTIVCGGPESLAKVYATEVGEFGQIVGPKRDGLVDQFYSLGWKWYGGYGRFKENGLLRIEVSVGAEA